MSIICMKAEQSEEEKEREREMRQQNQFDRWIIFISRIVMNKCYRIIDQIESSLQASCLETKLWMLFQSTELF